MFVPMLVGCLLLSLATPVALQDNRTLDEAIRLYQVKQYGEAEKLLRSLLERDPKQVVARYYLGMTLLGLERYGAAEWEFRKAWDQPPGRDQIQIGLARSMLGMKRYETAEQALTEAQKINPNNPEIYLHRGKLLVEKKDYNGAVKELERAISLDPKQAYAHYYLGISYSNVKRPDKMVEHFGYFLKLAPEAPEAAKVKSVMRTIR